MSAGPRLQYTDGSDDSEQASSQHNYYMPHSESSSRELPALPGTAARNGASPRGRIQSAPQQPYGEQIPLQSLSPQHSSQCHPPVHPPGDARYHRSEDADAAFQDHFPREDFEGNAVQYFRVAPSGQLLEEGPGAGAGEGEVEEEEALSTVNTYSLSSPEEDRSTLNTYSLSPHESRAAQPGTAAPTGDPEAASRDRSESLTPTAYSGVVAPQRSRSDSYPPASYGEVILPMRITPEMVALFMQQRLVESAQAQQQWDLPQAGGASPPGLQSPSSSSLVSSTHSSTTPKLQRQQQQQQQPRPGYRQQLSQPANVVFLGRGAESPVQQTGQAHPPAALQRPQQLSLAVSLSPEGQPASAEPLWYPPSVGQSLQTGVYAQLHQLQRPRTAPQFAGLTDMPQTDLSTPYAELAQVRWLRACLLNTFLIYWANC